MTSGCTKDDYSLFMGNGTCVVVSLTDNQLLCILPLEKPLNVDNANAVLCSDDHLPVIVSNWLILLLQFTIHIPRTLTIQFTMLLQCNNALTIQFTSHALLDYDCCFLESCHEYYCDYY